MNIVMLGPQGSGKGTQAKLIAEKYGITHLSTGDMFREQINQQSRLGKEAQKFINAGNLVPDEITIAMLKERIKTCRKGFVLDGFPRTLPQAKALRDITDIDYVVYVHISDEEAVKRLSGRWQCKKCNSIYGKINMPKDKKCKCSGELYQRDDDKPDAIKRRLQEYHQKTDHLIDFYKDKEILIEINGEQRVEKVFQDIIDALE